MIQQGLNTSFPWLYLNLFLVKNTKNLHLRDRAKPLSTSQGFMVSHGWLAKNPGFSVGLSQIFFPEIDWDRQSGYIYIYIDVYIYIIVFLGCWVMVYPGDKWYTIWFSLRKGFLSIIVKNNCIIHIPGQKEYFDNLETKTSDNCHQSVLDYKNKPLNIWPELDSMNHPKMNQNDTVVVSLGLPHSSDNPLYTKDRLRTPNRSSTGAQPLLSALLGRLLKGQINLASAK